MNIFQRIAILHYINNNKDKVEYGFKYNLHYSTGIHRLKIANNGSVLIEMHRDYCGNTNFGITYNINGGGEHSLPPCQLSFFDKSFVSRMYSKMMGYYVAKNGMPNNSR